MAAVRAGRLGAFFDSDLFYSFRRRPGVILAAAITAAFVVAALLAPWVAPHNPFDLATLNLLDALTPPHGFAGAKPEYDEAKWLGIINKTWGKMSKGAREFALSGKIKLPEPLVPLITKAISQ